jgi:hypothetical protein
MSQRTDGSGRSEGVELSEACLEFVSDEAGALGVGRERRVGWSRRTAPRNSGQSSTHSVITTSIVAGSMVAADFELCVERSRLLCHDLDRVG